MITSTSDTSRESWEEQKESGKVPPVMRDILRFVGSAGAPVNQRQIDAAIVGMGRSPGAGQKCVYLMVRMGLLRETGVKIDRQTNRKTMCYATTGKPPVMTLKQAVEIKVKETATKLRSENRMLREENARLRMRLAGLVHPHPSPTPKRKPIQLSFV